MAVKFWKRPVAITDIRWFKLQPSASCPRWRENQTAASKASPPEVVLRRKATPVGSLGGREYLYFENQSKSNLTPALPAEI